MSRCPENWVHIIKGLLFVLQSSSRNVAEFIVQGKAICTIAVALQIQDGLQRGTDLIQRGADIIHRQRQQADGIAGMVDLVAVLLHFLVANDRLDQVSAPGFILCGAALVVAAPVAAAAAIPVCAAIGTVGIGLGASSSAVVSAGITAVGAVETAATTIGTTLGGVGLAEAVKDVRQ